MKKFISIVFLLSIFCLNVHSQSRITLSKNFIYADVAILGNAHIY